jgi:nucleoside-diphosphate-sugar epimerase
MNGNTELHVIFGTGPVGAEVMRELRRRGKQVRMVSRGGKPSKATGEVQGVEFVSADAYNAASVLKAAQGATHIYQCAQPAYHEWVEKFMPFQQTILDAAIATGAKLIIIENLYMYGDTGGKRISETLPYHPTTKKGKVRTEMAQAWQTAHQQGKVRAVAGRASDFFGPAYDVMGDQIFYPALAGKAAQGIGNIDVPHSFTYTPDVGKALVILGERDEALGQAWHIPAVPPVTQRELITMAFKAAGQPVKISAINKLMMRMAGLFIPAARETIEMMYEWEKPFIMDSSTFERAFGMEATPLPQAIADTIAWYRAHPHTS